MQAESCRLVVQCPRLRLILLYQAIYLLSAALGVHDRPENIHGELRILEAKIIYVCETRKIADIHSTELWEDCLQLHADG